MDSVDSRGIHNDLRCCYSDFAAIFLLLWCRVGMLNVTDSRAWHGGKPLQVGRYGRLARRVLAWWLHWTQRWVYPTDRWYAYSQFNNVIRNLCTNFGSRPSDHYFRSVCLSVCLFVQSFSQPSLIRFRWNLDICYISGSIVVSPRI